MKKFLFQSIVKTDLIKTLSLNFKTFCFDKKKVMTSSFHSLLQLLTNSVACLWKWFHSLQKQESNHKTKNKKYPFVIKFQIKNII